MKKFLISGLAACAAIAPAAQAITLWDSGAPHTVIFNNSESYLGYTSGNAGPGLEQRWAAQPFSIPSPGAVVSQIDVDFFIPAGSEPENVTFIVWNRSGLTAPTTMYTMFTLAIGPGLDDPRVTGVDNWLYQYSGLNVNLPGGDYYLTVYGVEGPIAWLTGADLQPESLEQGFMWRSATFPSPGFQPYAPAVIQPVAGQDPDDRWNTSFVIYGEIIPAPSSLAMLGLGMVFARRRR